MEKRWKIIVTLVIMVAVSAWLLNLLSDEKSTKIAHLYHEPDYYMENFITTIMESDGTPKNEIRADYMAHYPDNDTTELINPVLTVYRQDDLPMTINADKGWVTENNEVILLSGNVTLKQNDRDGNRKLEVITSDVKILSKQNYAETDKPATLIGKRTIVKATGVRAWLEENRLELLNNVHTKILQENIH